MQVTAPGFQSAGNLLDRQIRLSNSGRCIAARCAPHYDEPMSFSETIFLFFLALLVFGPKKLPEIARQAGKLLAELRRASNEFKSQIESEIAHIEVEERQKALPPVASPRGTVASLSLNPAASEPSTQISNATLAVPVADPILPPAVSVDRTGASESSGNGEASTPSPTPTTLEAEPAIQDSHA
jgi:TatA/E family protein of Tat protein translocase